MRIRSERRAPRVDDPSPPFRRGPPHPHPNLGPKSHPSCLLPPLPNSMPRRPITLKMYVPELASRTWWWASRPALDRADLALASSAFGRLQIEKQSVQARSSLAFACITSPDITFVLQVCCRRCRAHAGPSAQNLSSPPRHAPCPSSPLGHLLVMLALYPSRPTRS